MVSIRKWDVSEYIKSEEDAIAYLNAADKIGDPAVLQASIEDIARTRSRGQVAKEAGAEQEAFTKASTGAAI